MYEIFFWIIWRGMFISKKKMLINFKFERTLQQQQKKSYYENIALKAKYGWKLILPSENKIDMMELNNYYILINYESHLFVLLFFCVVLAFDLF